MKKVKCEKCDSIHSIDEMISTNYGTAECHDCVTDNWNNYYNFFENDFPNLDQVNIGKLNGLLRWCFG